MARTMELSSPPPSLACRPIDNPCIVADTFIEPPTLILIGPDGNERRELRVVGEINAREFLERLDTAGTP